MTFPGVLVESSTPSFRRLMDLIGNISEFFQKDLQKGDVKPRLDHARTLADVSFEPPSLLES